MLKLLSNLKLTLSVFQTNVPSFHLALFQSSKVQTSKLPYLQTYIQPYMQTSSTFQT